MTLETSFASFSLGLKQEGSPLIAPDRFIEAFRLRQSELAALAKVHRSTVAEAPSNAKLQRFMRDTLRVVSAARDVAGDRDRAIYWYRNTPIAEFDHSTAEQMVSAGETEAVLKYLLSIESGSTG